jgi:hypothetical protein
MLTGPSQGIGWSRSAASKALCKQMPTLNSTETSRFPQLTRCLLVWVEVQQGTTAGDAYHRSLLDHAAG